MTSFSVHIKSEYLITHLEALQKFKINELVKKHKSFQNEWIKKKKCDCVKSLRKDRTLNCKHYKKAIKEKFEIEEEKIKRLGLFLLKIRLYLNPKFPNQWLHSLKL